MRRLFVNLAPCRSSSFLIRAMNTRHLGKGSTNPPLQKNKLRLYSMRFCPYAQRAHLVLDAKKIPYDIVNVNLKDKPEWYFELNPIGKVPAIQLPSGDCIYESLIIADYLDEKFPQTPLHSKDLLQKAKDRILIELSSQVARNIIKFYRNNDDDHFEAFMQSLDIFEKELALRKTTFFAGDRPGMLDYMIWPWMERSHGLELVAGDAYILPWDRFLSLSEWMNQMMNDEAVEISYIGPQDHSKFLLSLLSDAPEYDILVE